MRHHLATVIGWLRRGWQTYRENRKALMTAGLIYCALLYMGTLLDQIKSSALASMLSFVFTLALPMLMAGFSYYCLLTARNDRPSLRELFYGFKRPRVIWLYLLLMLGFAVGVLLIGWIGPIFAKVIGFHVALASKKGALVIFLIALVLTGLVLVRYAFSVILMIDKNSRVWESLRAGAILSKGSRIDLILLYVTPMIWWSPIWLVRYLLSMSHAAALSWALAGIGVITWIASSLIIYPWLSTSSMHVYDELLEKHPEALAQAPVFAGLATDLPAGL